MSRSGEYALVAAVKIYLLILGLAIACGGGRVIVMTVDGLRPDAITVPRPALAPNFHRLREEGALTDNAPDVRPLVEISADGRVWGWAVERRMVPV